MNKNKTIVVLSDYECYSLIKNCVVMELTETGGKKIIEGEYPKNLNIRDMENSWSISQLVEFWEFCENNKQSVLEEFKRRKVK